MERISAKISGGTASFRLTAAAMLLAGLLAVCSSFEGAAQVDKPQGRHMCLQPALPRQGKRALTAQAGLQAVGRVKACNPWQQSRAQETTPLLGVHLRGSQLLPAAPVRSNRCTRGSLEMACSLTPQASQAGTRGPSHPYKATMQQPQHSSLLGGQRQHSTLRSASYYYCRPGSSRANNTPT